MAEGPGYEASFPGTGGGGGGDMNLDLGSVPVRVKNVIFNGLSRTKSDFLQDAIQGLFLATNFDELIERIAVAQVGLKKLGVFAEIGTVVDTSKAIRAGKDDYEITFLVRELRRINGGVNTMVGTNEGMAQMGINFPNIFGRGEKISMSQLISSSRERKAEISFSKPYPTTESQISASAFHTKNANPWCGINTSSTGSQVSYSAKLGKSDSLTFQWQGVWRQLSSLGQTSFPVRLYCGDSMKSSLKLTHTKDTRPDPIFPTWGMFRKLSIELAGFMGDARFMKVDSDLSWSWGFLQATFRTGFLQPFGRSPTAYNINDLLFLGGPSCVRGFEMKGVGPRAGTNALGGTVSWSAGLHLYSPFPYLKQRFPICENLRFHGFLNAGSIGESIADCCDPKYVRASCGLGIAYRFFTMARLELNYCLPFMFEKQDKTVKGFQFGLGVEFL